MELDSLPKGTRTAIRLKTSRSFANLTKQTDQSNLEVYKTNKLQPYAFKINLKDKILESENIKIQRELSTRDVHLHQENSRLVTECHRLKGELGSCSSQDAEYRRKNQHLVVELATIKGSLMQMNELRSELLYWKEKASDVTL